MLKKLSRKSVVYKWLLSYMFVLIIPLVILIASTVKFLSIYENEIIRSNSLILEQSRMKMDRILYEAKSFVAEISIDPMIRKLLTADDRTEFTSYDLYQTTLMLNRLLLTKNEDFEFLVYFLHHDITVSNYSYNNWDEFFNIYLSQKGLEKSVWDGLVGQKYSVPHYFAYEHIQPSGKTSSRIAMISPVMIEKYPGMYANIVVFIDESNLEEYSSKYFDRDTFLIMDSENQILYKSGNYINVEGIPDYSMLDAGPDNMSAVLGKENVIITHIDSQAVNWKYIIITAEKAYMGQLNILRNKMVLSVVLCCVIGSLIIFYLLRHNYTPLKSVVKSIEESAAELADGVMNEFQYITQTIKQLQNEKKVTNEIMKKQKRTLSSQMVLNLVENRDITNEIDLHTLEKYDICFQSDIFLVLTFFVFDGEGPFPNDNEIIDDKEKNKMICLIIQNITEELFREKDIKTFFFHTGRLIGFIINPPPGNESALIDDISDKHEQVTNSINRYFLIKFVSACSDMHRTLKAIPAAYSEALQVIEYNSMFGFNKVLFYHDLVELPREENFYYPEETENYIINNLKIGNAETVCDTIKKIIDLNIENNSAPVTIRYLVVNIAGTIIKVINQFEKKKYSIPQLSFQALLQENSLSEMYNKIEKNVHAVCEAIKRQNDGKKKPVCADLYEKAINIVKENYSNTNLNVAMIAQELDVHVVHLSRTFMKYHGESLSYYINSVRLAEAKKLIHTGQKLEAISEKVGFGSLRTFMRVFKKYEGITPGQYKEALEKVH
jgi:two-component system response regulator YesN